MMLLSDCHSLLEMLPDCRSTVAVAENKGSKQQAVGKKKQLHSSRMMSPHLPGERARGEGSLGSSVKDGNSLVLGVSAKSPRGEFPYTIFVHESMTYARGQSPPRIIVR